MKISGSHRFLANTPRPCIKYPLKKYSSKLVCNGIKTIEIKTRIKKGIGLKLKLKSSGDEKYSNKIKQKVVAPQAKKANQKRLQSMVLLEVVMLFKDCL